MKKLLVLLVVFMMLAGCSNKETDINTNTENETSKQNATPATVQNIIPYEELNDFLDRKAPDFVKYIKENKINYLFDSIYMMGRKIENANLKDFDGNIFNVNDLKDKKVVYFYADSLTAQFSDEAIKSVGNFLSECEDITVVGVMPSFYEDGEYYIEDIELIKDAFSDLLSNERFVLAFDVDDYFNRFYENDLGFGSGWYTSLLVDENGLVKYVYYLQAEDTVEKAYNLAYVDNILDKLDEETINILHRNYKDVKNSLDPAIVEKIETLFETDGKYYLGNEEDHTAFLERIMYQYMNQSFIFNEMKDAKGVVYDQNEITEGQNYIVYYMYANIENGMNDCNKEVIEGAKQDDTKYIICVLGSDDEVVEYCNSFNESFGDLIVIPVSYNNITNYPILSKMINSGGALFLSKDHKIMGSLTDVNFEKIQKAKEILFSIE